MLGLVSIKRLITLKSKSCIQLLVVSLLSSIVTNYLQIIKKINLFKIVSLVLVMGYKLFFKSIFYFKIYFLIFYINTSRL
jgi:hypothetical protein